MLHRNPSLRFYLTGTLLATGMVLVAGYSLLSADYFVRGMDSIMSAWLEEAAEHYIDNVPPEEQTQPVALMGNVLAPSFRTLPVSFQQAFDHKPPEQLNHLTKIRSTRDWEIPNNLYFLMHYSNGVEEVFVGRYVTRETASTLVKQQKTESGRLLVWVSLGIALALGLFIWLLLRQVSGPMEKLAQWTRRLTPQKLTAPVPDFTYPELNEMAGLIRSSLSSVQDTLEREQRFLRHASHELRTPISVIRSNVCLMRKIRTTPDCQSRPEKEKQVMERVDRASLTMKHLTETLLWLSRDEKDPLPTEEVKLGDLLKMSIEVLEYLLQDKSVKVTCTTDESTVLVPVAPVKIVLGNLVRNAYQHSWQGEISIIQEGGSVHIKNPIPESSEVGASDPGFGLGLQLTERLTRRMGWDYQAKTEAGVYHASVCFSEWVNQS